MFRMRIFWNPHKSWVTLRPHNLMANLPNGIEVYFLDDHAGKIIKKMCANA
jgi:hypothetical protein